MYRHVYMDIYMYMQFIRSLGPLYTRHVRPPRFRGYPRFLFSHSAGFFGLRFFPVSAVFFFHPTPIIKQHSHRNWFVSSRLLMFLVETLHKNDTQEEEENLIKWSKLCLKVVIKGSRYTVELVLYLIHMYKYI